MLDHVASAEPSGNSSELCNIDSHLNKYLHKAVDFHFRYTNSLHKLCLKKFSIASPKKGTSAYFRIFDPIGGVVLLIEHIISNMYDVLTSIKDTVEAGGCIIPDVNNVKNMRKGWRREVWGSKDTNHGGERVHILAECDYGEIPKKNCTKMHTEQKKFSSSYHISCSIVMM